MKNTIITVFLSMAMAGCLLLIGAATVGVVWYTWPTSSPEVQYQERVVEAPVEVERVITQVIEKIVTATPAPEALQYPIENALLPTSTATPTEIPSPPCTNIAWVVSQPVSDLQAGALEIGRIKRLHFIIRNEGSCPWDGYVLTSAGVLPDIPIPFTPPGGLADFSIDITVSRSFIARFALMAANGDLFGVLNTTSPDMIIYYRLDAYTGKNVIQVPPALGGGTITCTGAG